MCHHSGQTTNKRRIDKSTDNSKLHLTCFSEQELEKALCGTLTRAALSGLFSTMAN